MSSLPTYNVRTENAFLTAIARTTPTRIVLGAQIPVSYTVTIPERHTVVTGGHGFVRHASGMLVFHGTLEADHRQVFFGFSPGQVVGTFRQPEVRPVWWGAYGRTASIPAVGADTRDDIGINCAIQSILPGDTVLGRRVALDCGAYHVGRPIDLSGRNAVLEGAGPNRTFITTTTQWTCDEWKNDVMYGLANHGAVIWAGGAAPQSVQSYNSSVRDVYVNGVYASSAHLASGKRVSGISTYGWMEEHTAIENVTVEGFSGYGVGAVSALSPGTPNLQRVMNGFALRKFWITTGMSPTCLPVAVGMQSAAASIRDGTIDMNPGTVRQLVHVGIWAQGKHTIIENVHIEHVRHGVMVRGSLAQNQAVLMNGVDLLYGHDANMTSPPVSSPPPVVTTTELPAYPIGFASGYDNFTDLFAWSTVVSILGEPIPVRPQCLTGYENTDQIAAYHPRVTATAISGESVKYLVRDWGMGRHIPCWRTEQAAGHSGMLGRYYRSNMYVPKSTDATNPRLYFAAAGGGIGVFPSDGKTYVQILE